MCRSWGLKLSCICIEYITKSEPLIKVFLAQRFLIRLPSSFRHLQEDSKIELRFLKAEVAIRDLARMYLKPRYGNEVFGNFYLSTGHNITVMGVVDTFRLSP